MLSFLLNQIWIGIDYFLLKFFTTFGSVLRLQVTALIRVSQIIWDCLLCLFKCWALSLTSETCLLHCLSSCHQTYSWLDTYWSNPFSWLIIVIPYTYLMAFSTVYHFIYCMCGPILMSRLLHLLVFLCDILHAIAKLNKASPCVAANSEHFDVSMLSTVMMLWACGRAYVDFIYFPNYFFSLSWITYECCSHNYESPWAEPTKERVNRTTLGIIAIEIPLLTRFTLP